MSFEGYSCSGCVSSSYMNGKGVVGWWYGAVTRPWVAAAAPFTHYLLHISTHNSLITMLTLCCRSERIYVTREHRIHCGRRSQHLKCHYYFIIMIINVVHFPTWDNDWFLLFLDLLKNFNFKTTISVRIYT